MWKLVVFQLTIWKGESLSLTSEVCFNITLSHFVACVGERKDTNATILTKVMVHPLEESKKLAHLITKTDFLSQSLQK